MADPHSILMGGEPPKERKRGDRDMGLRAAINAKCRDCIVDELAAGSAAVQVELCACYGCPLWPVRKVRPEADRGPYSAPVLAEQGLTPELAAFRLAHPYDVPPAALHLSNSGRSTGRAGEDGAMLPDAGLAA